MSGPASLRAGSPRRIWAVQGVLLSLAAALGGVLWWEWQQARQLQAELAQARRVPDTAVPALSIAPPFRLPDEASGFPELLSRPIFQASRRPALDPAASGPTGFKRGQFILVGVLMSPALQSALLRDVETGKTQAVAVGAQIRGLTLAEVGADRAVLRLDEETEELPLQLQRGAAAPLQAATPAQAAGNEGGQRHANAPQAIPAAAAASAAQAAATAASAPVPSAKTTGAGTR